MVDPIALPTLHDFPASHLRQVTTRRVQVSVVHPIPELYPPSIPGVRI